MPTEQNNNSIELIVGGFVCTSWDSVSIDSDLEIPADSWSLTIFHPDQAVLPPQVQAGQVVTLHYRGQLVLKGVLDQLQESVSRSGRQMSLSGRDLAALLLDNSVNLGVQQQLSIIKASGSYFFADPVAKFFNQGILINFAQSDELVERIIAVEPAESLWQFLSKAAEIMGQYIWVDAQGVIQIGNPFKQKQPPVPLLLLKRDGQRNNVLSAQYTEDATELYSEVIVLGQDNQTQTSFYATATEPSTPEIFNGQDLTPSAANQPNPPEFVGRTQRITPTPRRKIVLDSLADTAAQATQRAKKLMQDGQLSAYNLVVTVAGWTCPTGQVWTTGWTVQFETDVMSARVSGDWVILGRTLELSRAGGKTTQLKLKRQQFWMQPVAPSPDSVSDDPNAEPTIDEVY